MKLTQERFRILSAIFEEIVTYYGPSKFHPKRPTLNIFHDGSHRSMGEHNEVKHGQEVSVNVALCDNMKDAVGTLIHEYHHHHQHPASYWRYHRMYGASGNPYEIEADRVAARDLHLFWPR